MIVFLIDNGSLKPAAQRNLRAVAAALGEQLGDRVYPVSWKHADRIRPAALDGDQAWTLETFVRSMAAQGDREFVAVPFFVSSQGAIGAALRRDLDQLTEDIPGTVFTVVDGRTFRRILPAVAAARVREVITTLALTRPPVIVVDHGGPSTVSAALRDELAAEIRAQLQGEIGLLAAASMEGRHPPLLGAALRDFEAGALDLVVAPLFLSPGRHAGSGGDIAALCRSAAARCHIAELLGTHPAVVDALAADLRRTLCHLPTAITA